MGNCCSQYQLFDDHCSRCGRKGHHYNECHSSTYYDGSMIIPYCRNCQRSGHSYSDCPNMKCTIL